MAQNPIPDAVPTLFALAEDMADGAHTHEAAIGLKQNTEAALRADLAAAQKAQTDWLTAKMDKDTFSTALRVADSNARAFLKSARVVLAQNLGETWSAAWAATGFPHQSTAVPASQADRLALCSTLKDYFTANPTLEVNTPKLVVTAARAARQAMNHGNTDAGAKKQLRDAAVEALKARLRGLIGELGQLLGPTDPLWEGFGLHEPGAVAMPETPVALVLTPGQPGTVLADWADSRHAARYRVWVKVEGVDADFRAAATVSDSDATLENLPSGATVSVRVTAANDAGESTPGDTVTVKVREAAGDMNNSAKTGRPTRLPEGSTKRAPSWAGAFTLMELLVTITVVAILTALLLVAIGRSSQRAKRVSCQSVLRQVYLATVMYADDHDGYMPDGKWFFYGPGRVNPRCPGIPAELMKACDDQRTYGGYDWRWYGGVKLSGITPKNILLIDCQPWHDPGRSVVVFDDGDYWQGRVNELRADGQIVWMPPLTMRKDLLLR